MKLTSTPELRAFLSTYFSDGDVDSDEENTHAFIASVPPERLAQVVAQAKTLLADSDFPIEELGMEANRWFGEAEEARAWLRRILRVLEGAHAPEAFRAVRDSNGNTLAEGDAVQVIKDLKVKGGSSDLKRGTLIKKIHLIENDPEVIECRMEGSTLVLKTCFLKKA